MKEVINENTRHAAYFDPRQPKPNGNEKELEEDNDDYTEEVWGDEDDEGDEIEEEDDSVDEDFEADRGDFEEEGNDDEDEF